MVSPTDPNIEADLQTVEDQLSSVPASPGQAVFQSIRSALGNIRQRLSETPPSTAPAASASSPTIPTPLWDRFLQAERAHEHCIPLPIVQQQQRSSSTSVLGLDLSVSSRYDDAGSVSSRRSQLLASRKPDGAGDRDLHESTGWNSTSVLGKVENDPDEPMDEIEVIFEDTVVPPPGIPFGHRSHSAPTIVQTSSSPPPPSSSSTLYAWGEQAQAVTTLPSVVSCALNDHHVACTTVSGQVWTAGRNLSGEVSGGVKDSQQDGDQQHQQHPVRIDVSQAHIAQVSCGYDHTAALRSNGAVLTWGGNEHGQLGHRNAPASAFFCRPAVLALPHRVTQVACGDGFTVCVTARMEVWTCGVLSAGAPNTTSSTTNNNNNVPRRMLPHLPVVAVAAGRRHAVAVTAHGSAFVWGDNSMGNCGQQVPKFLNSPVPVKLPRKSNEESLPHPLTGWTRNLTTGCSNRRLPKSRDDPCRCIAVAQKIVSAACGSDHTVLVTEEGELVVFGRNQEGQLGVSGLKIVDKPHLLPHPNELGRFVQADAGSAHTVALDDAGVVWRLGGGNKALGFEQLSPKGIVIRSVAAGGDNTLAIAANSVAKPLNALDQISRENGQQYLNECLDAFIQQSSLDKEAMDTTDSTISVDMVTAKTEELFRTPAVLNSGFLDPMELDTLFEKIGTVQVSGFQKKIAAAIEKGMLYGLDNVRSDVNSLLKWPEQVRFFLLLVQCPLFVHWDNHEDYKFDRRGDVVLALCDCILSLPYEGYLSLMAWATELYPRDLFVRFLIRPLLQQIAKCLAVDAGAERRPLRGIVAVLKWLYTASERVEGSAQSEDYYSDAIGSMNPEVLFGDLHRYKNATPQQKKADFFFAANSFLFSPTTKRNLLHMENEVSMMRSAASGVSFNMMQGGFLFRPYFVLDVDRQNLLQETLNKVAGAETKDLQKKLRVVFRGEEGVDVHGSAAGGVTREFFQLLTSQLFDLNTGMWCTTHIENQVTWFNGGCFWNDEGYYLSGVLVGLAVYNSALLDVSFPQAVYRKLLGLPLGLEDMVDETVREGLKKLLLYEGDDVEDVFCLSFDVSWMDLGVQKRKELKPDGSNIAVTSTNKEEYVKLYVQWSLVDSVYVQFERFQSGFMKVMENSSLELLRAEELELLVVGTPDLNFEALEANTEYEGGYTKDNAVVQNFWKFVRSAPRSQQLNLLKFTTGATKAPIGGLGNMDFKIQRAGPDSINLPTTHTCFNTLLLPDYGEDYEKLKTLLGRAIIECEGFGLQ